jgi:tetratricopeptide (TPR) repeat protein
MIVSADLQRQTQLRLAKHYVNKLRTANDAFEQGHVNIAYGLQIFDNERAQIERWQAWLAARIEQDEAVPILYSELTQGGIDILNFRLPPSESRVWYETGLAAARCVTDLTSELLHLLWLGNSYFQSGLYEQALTYVQQGHDLAVQLKDTAKVAKSLHSFSKIHVELGNVDLARQQIQASLKLYRQLGDHHGTADALRTLGFMTVYQGNWSEGEVYLQEAIDLLISMGNQVDLADALVKLAMVAQSQGRIAEAWQYSQQALTILGNIGDEQGMIYPLQELAIVADSEGSFSSASHYYLRALDIAQRYGRERFSSIILLNLGYSYYLQGQYEDARRYLEDAFPALQKIGFTPAAAVTLVNLVPVYIHLNLPLEADKALHKGLIIISQIDTPVYKIAFLVAATQLQMSNPQPPEQAARWAGLALTSPQAEHDNRVEIDKLRPKMEAAFGAERLTALLEEGSKLDFDEAFQQVVDAYKVNV